MMIRSVIKNKASPLEFLKRKISNDLSVIIKVRRITKDKCQIQIFHIFF